MIQLAISVEGRTEEEFVNQVLAGHLRESGVEPTPILLGRARNRFGGGNVSVDRLVSEMALLFGSFDAVTSLVDFYGFRRKGDKTVDELEEKLTQQIRKRIDHHRQPEKVLPYVQRHEFEGLLFSDVEAFANAIDVPEKSVEKLRRIRAKFTSPEDINDNSNTAPSKRIVKVIPRYRKDVDGLLLAREIGLVAIRAECQRFNDWVTRLESLGESSLNHRAGE